MTIRVVHPNLEIVSKEGASAIWLANATYDPSTFVGGGGKPGSRSAEMVKIVARVLGSSIGETEDAKSGETWLCGST